jgi:hypothetical protein
MLSHKPRIFISSTIYDFHDLRSALKYWLEQLGYEVWLSEFNDGEKSLDANALEACFEAIMKADYYILLLGARVGGYYDETERISITRQEYRTAYSEFQKGKLRLALFVRSELWIVRSDREALKQYLEHLRLLQEELDPADIDAIAYHSSTYATDPELIFNFIDEITRSEEMKLAVKGDGAFPSGNWVHQFKDFSEIVEALRIEFHIQDNLSQNALSINLKNELLSNLAEMLMKTNSGLSISSSWTNAARRNIKGGMNDFSQMSAAFVRWVALFIIIRPAADKLSVLHINEALASGNYLEFDAAKASYSPGQFVKRLLDLRRAIEQMKRLNGIIDGKNFVLLENYWRGKDDDYIVNVKNDDMTVALAYSDAIDNVIALSTGLIRWLDGDTEKLDQIILKSTAPFEDEAAKLSQEHVSSEEAYSWLNANYA